MIGVGDTNLNYTMVIGRPTAWGELKGNFNR